MIFKKSAYQIYVREHRVAHIARLVDSGHSSVSHMLSSDREQGRALKHVADTLRKMGIRPTLRYRAEASAAEHHDLVITVGGDGTLLEASHSVRDAPVLAVNSSPSSSVGYLSGATITTFAARMEELLQGRLPVVPLHRLELVRNGRVVGVPVLNDVLFCASNPATTSRYHLTVGAAGEEQKSSGIWVAAPAGSTAALRSAGGPVLPARSRELAYVVREPYHAPGQRLTLLTGVLSPETKLAVVPRMRQSAAYLDGSHVVVRLKWGDELEIRPHAHPLQLLGFKRRPL